MAAAARKYRGLFGRLRLGDVSTAQGRAHERQRRLLLTAAASMASKVISVGTSLISIPLTYHYLGSERFGMWMTINSFVALLTFTDLGIGNGVLSLIARAHGKDNKAEVVECISSALVALVSLSAALAVLFAALYPVYDWARLFNVRSSIAALEAGPSIAVLICCLLAAGPASVVQRVQMGLQQGFAASVWQCIGSFFSLLGVLLVVYGQGGLPWLVVAFAGAPVIAGILNSAMFFTISEPTLRPTRSAVSSRFAREIVKKGFYFFLIQLLMALSYSTTNLVIAQVLGPDAVAEYAVPDKLFAIVSMSVAMVTAPLWPAYSEAVSRGDRAWVASTVRRAAAGSILFSAAGSLLLVVLGPLIIKHWVGSAVVPTITLLASFALWKVVDAVGNVLSSFLNGLQMFNIQLYVAVPTAIATLLLKIYLVGAVGLPGVLAASIISYCLFTAVPLTLLVRRTLSRWEDVAYSE